MSCNAPRLTLLTTEYPKIETLYARDERTHKIDPRLILKNPTYGLLKSWVWTEKIDGTNIRCIWEDGKLTFGGRTNNAAIPAQLVTWLYENVSVDKLREIFPDVDVVIYGEGYGAGIQKGGGDYSAEKKFIVFDVRVDRWWLNDENMRDVAARLGLDAVHSYGDMSLNLAAYIVNNGIESQLAFTNGVHRTSEGMVGRPHETLFDKKGSRLIVKLKTHDFANPIRPEPAPQIAA